MAIVSYIGGEHRLDPQLLLTLFVQQALGFGAPDFHRLAA